MDNLIAFVKARLDDDERYARVFLMIGQRLKENPSPGMVAFGKATIDAVLDDPEAVTEAMSWRCAAPNDLNRVLREVAAKRAIVADYSEVADAKYHDYEGGAASAFEEVFKQLAAVWADHPDYRSEWAP